MERGVGGVGRGQEILRAVDWRKHCGEPRAVSYSVFRRRRDATRRGCARHLILASFPESGRRQGGRAAGERQESRVLTGCLGRSSRNDVNPICAEYDERGAPPGGRPAGRGGAELVGDNNDLSRRDIMLIRNLQFFLRVCPRPRPPCPRAPPFLLLLHLLRAPSRRGR